MTPDRERAAQSAFEPSRGQGEDVELCGDGCGKDGETRAEYVYRSAGKEVGKLPWRGSNEECRGR